MVVAEFLFIAFVVGILTKAWLGFLGTFLGLYAIYRFTRLSALLSFVLSLYWGLLGFHLGAALGGVGAGALLAVVGFVVGLGVHRVGVPAGSPQRAPVSRGSSGDLQAEPVVSPYAPRSVHGMPPADVIDAEYRVIS
jgi:hypothetical protein